MANRLLKRAFLLIEPAEPPIRPGFAAESVCGPFRFGNAASMCNWSVLPKRHKE